MSRQSQHTLTKYSFVLQWFEDSIYRYQIVSLTLQSTQVAIIRRPICEMLVNGASSSDQMAVSRAICPPPYVNLLLSVTALPSDLIYGGCEFSVGVKVMDSTLNNDQDFRKEQNQNIVMSIIPYVTYNLVTWEPLSG